MNRELVESIINVITTSTDKNVVYKGLYKLRTDLVKDREGIMLFREVGGISGIVRFLNKPHEKILEVALSILGNCCTDNRSCEEALERKVFVPLAIILKSIPNPVIQCRACRLLGNLAKSDATQLLATHYSAIAHALCQIIEDTSDVQTRIMAYRACRYLLANPQFLKHYLQANGFVLMLRIFAAVMKNDEEIKEVLLPIEEQYAIGLKNNIQRDKYFEEVARNLEGVRSDIFDHEVLKNSARASNAFALPKEAAALDLAYEILKCLLIMSELQISLHIWETLNRFGSTIAPIVYYASEESRQRAVALRILSNFSKNPGAFYMLSNADAIVAACELLVAVNMSKSLTDSESRHCVNIVCMLSTDACNRSKIRRSGALRKLIAMMRDSNSQTEKSSILYLLNNFQYDNMSMELMLREGLISVLIRELNEYLISDDDHHKKKREERLQTATKRKISECATETICKFPKTQQIGLFDCDSPSSSPRSYPPSSPCSSRGMSPVGNSFAADALIDDENYSPACSDDDDEATDDETTNQSQNVQTNTNGNSVDNSEIMQLLDIACQLPIDDNVSDKEDYDEASQDVPHLKLPLLGNLPRSIIDIIENLLFRVTLMINKRGELGKPETFETLIRAINVFGANNNFANALTNVLLESQFFAQIVKQGIAHQLYQLTKVEEMRKDGFGFLETLTNVGESNYGKAELVRLLRSDDLVSQKRAAITVAYIVRSQRLLYQFLNDGNALTLLFEMLLSSKSDEYTTEAADAVTYMSRYTLGITIPKIDDRDEFDDDDDDAVSCDVAGAVVPKMLPLHDDCDMRFVVYASTASTTTAEINDAPPACTVIGFNKQLLCATSDVFNTMLNSDFREGKESEIQLRQYSPCGLRYFLNLIVRQSRNLKFNIPPARKYHALLEAFEMSRIYIIPTMEQMLQQFLIQLLDAPNCLSLLEWALKNYHADLTETAINFYLSSTLSTDDKVALFRRADYSTYSTEWFQLINDAVYERCRNGF